jgi:uncharacterized protein
MERKTKIVDHIKKDFKGYYLVEGTPSPDMIATITTRYLIDNLKMEKIAHLESPAIIPIIRITNGNAEYPIRIYADHKHKLLVLVSDQLIEPNQIYDFSNTLINWCEEKKIKGIISLLGLIPNNSKLSIYGASNTKLDLLTKNNVPILEKGLITGIGAQIITLAKKIEAYILVCNPGNTTNFNSAAKLIDILEKIFGFDINTEPLEQESKKIISAIKEKMQQIKTQEENKSQMTFI